MALKKTTPETCHLVTRPEQAIRGMRIAVYDVLEYLASGMSQAENSLGFSGVNIG